MKKLASVIFALLLCCLACQVHISQAYAEERADKRIHLYGQDLYDFTSAGGFDLTTYTGSSKRNLKRNGCSAFTFAHGFQWITNKDCASADEYYRVLYGLLQVTRTPSKTGRTMFATYFTDTLKCAEAVTVTRTKAWMERFFEKGGVIVGHMRWPKTAEQSAGGHYMLAVGCTEHNGECLIHMVDSASRSTTSRVRCLDFDTYEPTVMPYTCGEYWIPLSEFITEAQFYNEVTDRGETGIWFEKGFIPLNGDASIYPAAPTITDVKAPQELKQGKSFALGGTIRSRSRITDVYATVTSLTTGKVWFDIRTTPLFYQYTIGSPSSGEAINDKIRFGQLKEDWYEYAISVVTEASATPQVVHSNVFSVGDPPGMLYFESIDNFPPAIAVSIRSNADADKCSLQSAPYDLDACHLSDIEKDTIVYIGGAGLNKQGQMWYVIEDAAGEKQGYIFSGDLRVTEENASAKLDRDQLDLLGIVGTEDGYLKDRPYEAADHQGRRCPKGKSVQIVASYRNSRDELWYRTAEGFYIDSADVATYECVHLFNISALFTNLQRRDSHAAPYPDSEAAASVGEHTDVTVTRFVANSHGDIWAQLEDGSYLCFCEADSTATKLKFSAWVCEPSVSDVQKPEGDLKTGSGYPLRGVINANAPFYTVCARVIDRETTLDALTPVTVSPDISASSVNINAGVNGVNINQNLPFGKLKTGWYTYKVDVQFGFRYARTGEVYLFGSEQTVIASSFTVGSPEGEPVLPEEGTVRVPGDADKDGKITPADAQLILSYAAGNDVQISLPNANVIFDGSVDQQDALRILQYLAGWDMTLE